MCSPILHLPSYKEPPECIPCYPVQGPKCLPCGMDPVTLRRPLIVHDSTFDYRPTSWPGMLLNNQDKKIRYQLINYERPVRLLFAIWGCCGGCHGGCCAPPCCSRPCGGGGSLVTVYSQVAHIQ